MAAKARLIHLRMRWGRPPRDRYLTRGGRKRTTGVCEANGIPFEDSAAKPGRKILTCPICAIFADAWLEAGMKGQLTVRRVRAFKQRLAVPQKLQQAQTMDEV